MSLILDALKKAEAERHLGQIPSLHMQPLASLPTDGTPSHIRKILLVVAAILLTAAIGALVWLRPWQKQAPAEQNAITQQVLTDENSVPMPSAGSPAHEVPASAPQQIIAASPPLETYKPSAKPSAPPKKTPTIASRSMLTDSAATSAPTAKEAPSSNRQTEPSTTTKTAKPTATASTATATGLNAVSADTASKSLSRQSASHAQSPAAGEAELKTALASPDAGTPSPRELPEQIQRELPNLMIGGYIYSDNPRERQLLVNRRLLYEGEEAAPGVTLEKMTPKAAVFNYRGYRYRLAY